MKDAPAIAARRIIGKFGGPARLARCLSIPASTVQSWQEVGIPVKWHHPVIFAGARAAVPIAPDDFFEPILEPLIESLRVAIPAELQNALTKRLGVA